VDVRVRGEHSIHSFDSAGEAWRWLDETKVFIRNRETPLPCLALPCLGLPCLALACLALLCFVFSIFPYENIAMSCRDRLGTNVPKENSPDNCPINGVFHTHTGGRHRYRVVLVAVLAAAGARFPVVADAQGAKKRPCFVRPATLTFILEK
jgi:hypothetical protein